jgi:hypothetical protein
MKTMIGLKWFGRTAVALAVFLVTGLLVATSYAWVACDRSFHFSGMMNTNGVIISFLEIGWQECQSTRLHNLIIDSQGKFVKDSIDQQWRSSAFDAANGPYDFTSVIRLRERDSVFQGPFPGTFSYKVCAPAFDSAFATAWADSLSKYAKTGYPRMFLDSMWLMERIDDPVFDKEVRFVYAYPYGSYKNYTILDVLVLRNYFLVLTHQPVTTNELTFDGVLVYKWKGW